MIIRYLPSAERDLLWFSRYYIEIFPAGGRAAANALKKAESILATHPEVGRSVEGMETFRRYRLQRTPFSLVYRATEETIDIVRIWDSRQEFLTLR